ncbi:MAG: HesA/MoeB/ThiF family protein [Spirochaetota bacterium]
MKRYERHRGLIPDDAWARLPTLRCVVAGAGGLGSLVIMLLGRLGPVTLDVWDPATVDEPDLNRQLLYGPDAIGRKKAMLAAEHIEATNPECTVTAYPLPLNSGAFAARYSGETDRIALFDCVDSMSARAQFHDIQRTHGVPVFHGAVEGWYGQAATIAPGSSGYDSILPPGWRDAAAPAKSVSPHIVTMVASVQVGEFIHWLCSGGTHLLGNALMHIDGKTMTTRRFNATGESA